MTTRLRNRLREIGIIRLNDLKDYTKEKLLKGRDFGPETLKELEQVMDNYNIRFEI